MKKYVLVLSIFLLAIIGSVSAQVDKGNYYLGGNVSFNYNSNGTTTLYTFQTGYTNYTVNKVSNLAINPEFGFFLSKNWAIGIQPNYTRTSGTETSVFTAFQNSGVQNSVSSDTYHQNVVGLTVNVRYYYMITDKIGIFPQFGLSSENDIKNFSNGELTFAASPNIVFFPTPKLGVNLGFGNVTYATDYHFNSSYVNIGLNNSISFGLNYYWGRK
jgi:hypothetical protein